MSEDKVQDEVLERNLSELLQKSHEPPRISAAARARILHELKARRVVVPLARRARWKQPLGAAMAAAAAVLLVWGVAQDPVRPLPTVVRGDATAARRVTLVDGSVAILNAGADLLQLAPRHLRLVRGDVLLDVVPGAGEFVVETPHGRVVVLGTRFVLRTLPDETRAAVARGRVRMENRAGDATLHAGEEGVMGASGRPQRGPAPRLSALTSWARDVAASPEAPPQGGTPVRRGTLISRDPRPGAPDFPLPVRDFTVDVHVENQVARTTIDQTFFNPTTRQLEGVYTFPLPPDAQVARLAMYVDGKLVEAGVVERQRGREIYESIVYRRRDPALLEWMEGNVFKVRIFPLPARSEKRILLSYTQTIDRLYDRAQLVVPIPELDGTAARVSFKARVVGGAAYELASTSHPVEVAEDGEDRIVTWRATDARLGDDFLLTLRARDGGDAGAAQTVRHVEAGSSRQFLMTRVQPEIPGAREWRPRRWVVLYDTSASRGPLDRMAQSYLVERLLREWDEDDQFTVVAFDATTRVMPGGFVRVGDADRAGVARFLAAEGRDGVGDTDLEAALAAAVGLLGASGDAGASDPCILYLGDGIATAGAKQLDALRARVAGKAMFVGIAVGDRMDAQVLQSLADATGGLYTAMNPGEDLGWRTFDLVATLNTPRVLGLRAELLDAEGQPLADVDVYPSAASLAAGEELSVVARVGGGGRAARLRLTGTLEGRPWTLETAVEPRAADARYLPRLWARRRVEALLRDGAEKHQDELTTLGMAHFLLTPFTSLLVLENDEMYREFKVNRGREDDWARYPAPKTIEVRYEPVGSDIVPDEPSANVILFRAPVPILPEDDGYGEGTVLGNSRGNEWGTIGHGAGGGGTRTTGGVAVTSQTEIDLMRERRPAAATPMSSSDRASAQQRIVVTGAKRVGWLGDDMTVAEEPAEKVAVGQFGILRDAKKAKSANAWGATKSPRGYRGAYWRPYPVAFNYAGDQRLDDLTELVPALFGDELDLMLEELRAKETDRAGTLPDDARALLEEALRRRAGERYRLPSGGTLTVDAGGRLEIARVLPSGLSERVVYDGADLVSVYAELGIAVRRRIGTAEPALLERLAPFALARPEHLARWYEVTLAGPRTIRLRVPGAAGDAVELELDDAYRLVAMRRLAAGSVTAELRFERTADALTVVAPDGERTVLAVVAAPAAPIPAAEVAGLAVVDLPLAQPAYWEARAARLQPGSAEWRHARRQLLASWAALGDGAHLWAALEELATVGKVSRGELALASRGLQWIPSRKALAKVTKPLGAGDPVADYVAASWTFHRQYNAAPFDAAARAHAGTLVGMMASYRALLAKIDGTAGPGNAKARYRAFARDYGYAPFRFIAAARYAQSWGWRDREGTIELWDDAAADPAWRTVAAFAAAEHLYNLGRYDEAAERFETVFFAALDAGEVPPLTYTARYAFSSSGRGEAGWRYFWTRFRTRVVRSGDPWLLLGFLDAALMTGETGDVGPAVAAFRGKRIEEPAVAAGLAARLAALGRPDDAWVILHPLVAADAPAHAGLLEQASYLAESQGRTLEAVVYLERAMAARADEPTPLAVLRASYLRLIGLHTKLAQSLSGSADAAAHADRALAAAARWRQDDPDNPEIDRACARLLFAAGKPEEAWRYLSTIIERHPQEGEAHAAVAGALESEGRLEEADRAWQGAITVEPTNPTWLLRRAQNLMAMGRDDEARALFAEIDEGTWQERFADVIWQARRFKKAMGR